MTVSKKSKSNILHLDIDAFIAKARNIIHEVYHNKTILSVPDYQTKTAANDQDYITKPLTPFTHGLAVNVASSKRIAPICRILSVFDTTQSRSSAQALCSVRFSISTGRTSKATT
ncbi:hypothetical protein AB7B87_28885 [Klebsiella pneumoniae]